jgi:hypothetical protein
MVSKLINFPENEYTTQINSGKKYYLPDFNSPGCSNKLCRTE